MRTETNSTELKGKDLSRKNPVIELPLKISFSEEGIELFIKNQKKLTRFRTADNLLEHGISLHRFTPKYLQRLILMDYISKIEVARTEFLSKRREIIDLTKLIVYSFLYKKFDNHVFRHLLKSPFIAQWNRVHPTRPIDERSTFDRSRLSQVLVNKQQQIKEISRQVLGSVIGEAEQDPLLSDEDKRLKIFAAERYLEHLSPFTWYILLQSQRSGNQSAVLPKIRETLDDYLEKVKIAEYFALIMMELATNAENARLQRLAKVAYRNNGNIERLILDKEVRDQLLKKMADKEEYLYLMWKIRGKHYSIGNEYRLQALLFNKEYEYRILKNEIENKKRIALQEKSLFDFYTERPELKMDNQLGLYYLSYLHEACEKLNIRFDSAVSQIEDDDLTIITLMLNFVS